MQFSGEERVVSGTPGAGFNPWRNERFIDVGNYWLENILWPIYKRTIFDKYQQMSNRKFRLYHQRMESRLNTVISFF